MKPNQVSSATNLTELAGFFPSCSPAKNPAVVTGIAPRFCLPGDTIEESLARQAANAEKIRKQLGRKRLADCSGAYSDECKNT